MFCVFLCVCVFSASVCVRVCEREINCAVVLVCQWKWELVCPGNVCDKDWLSIDICETPHKFSHVGGYVWLEICIPKWWVCVHECVSPCCVSLSAFPSSYSPLFPLHCPCSVLLSASLYPALSPSPSPGLALSVSPCLLYPRIPPFTHAHTHTSPLPFPSSLRFALSLLPSPHSLFLSNFLYQGNNMLQSFQMETESVAPIRTAPDLLSKQQRCWHTHTCTHAHVGHTSFTGQMCTHTHTHTHTHRNT